MKIICILLAVSLLGGCAAGARNSPPAVIYDFGLPAQRLPAAGAWSGLALDVRSPPWSDSLKVDYRLSYEEPLKQREYSGSRWAGAPSALLAQRLAQQLGLASGGGSSAACQLRVELHEFSQIFDSPQQSRALLQGSVRLVDSKRHLLAERQLRIETPATTPDAQGGVNALVAASNELGGQLASWLDGLGAAGNPCRSAHLSAP
jgi:cholesterol transport system auxiliary component